MNLDGTPRGKLRIACTVAFGKSQLIPSLPKFMDEFPEIEVSLDLKDRTVDLQAEGFDAVICFDVQDKNPDAVARRIMRSRRVLCASPEYVDRYGTPKCFAELAAHNCLGITGKSSRNLWKADGISEPQSIEAKGSFEGNDTDVLFRAALAGIGIARLPHYLASEKFQTRELIHVLPAYCPPSTDIVVLFAEKRNLAPKIRAFVDFLVGQFSLVEGAEEAAQTVSTL